MKIKLIRRRALDIVWLIPYKVGVLEIRNIYKRFDSQITDRTGPETSAALEAIDLQIAQGEFFSLLGPSGCGKSTLLRIIAGFEAATSGEILWQGRSLNDVPPRERPFNMVFQRYALFPHMTVAENVAFGPRLRRESRAHLKDRVADALEAVGLAGFADRKPETLSGGQAQRVALARAFINQPACVLLDEPLAALDQKLREQMHTELRALQKKLGMTFIFVTHDQEEAMLLSDRIAVMNRGRIEQVSSPRELYQNPSSIFCAQFVGRSNELAAQLETNYFDLNGNGFVSALGNGVLVKGRAICTKLSQLPRGGNVRFFVRPEHVRVVRDGSNTELNRLPAQLMRFIYRGQDSEMMLRLQDGSGTVLRSRAGLPSNLLDSASFAEGQLVFAEFAPHDTLFFASVQ